MKVLNKKASNLKRVEWTHDLFKSSPKKISAIVSSLTAKELVAAGFCSASFQF